MLQYLFLYKNKTLNIQECDEIPETSHDDEITSIVFDKEDLGLKKFLKTLRGSNEITEWLNKNEINIININSNNIISNSDKEQKTIIFPNIVYNTINNWKLALSSIAGFCAFGLLSILLLASGLTFSIISDKNILDKFAKFSIGALGSLIATFTSFSSLLIPMNDIWQSNHKIIDEIKENNIKYDNLQLPYLEDAVSRPYLFTKIIIEDKKYQINLDQIILK
jgi:hypothetical protein